MTAVHPVREHMLSMPIDPDTEARDLRLLDLSARTYTALHSAGYTTVDELLELEEETLLSIPGLQVRGVNELYAKLTPYRPVDDRPEIVVDPDEEDDPPVGETPTFVEEWRPILRPEIVPGHTVSSAGRIKSPLDRELSRLATVKSAQPHVSLRRADKPGQSTSARVAVLVLEAFVSARPKGKDVLYKDGNFDNCHLSNLTWVSTDHPELAAQRRTAGLKSAATRAAKKVNSKAKRGPKPIAPVPLGAVSVEQTYRCGQVAITINDDNLSNWPTGLATPQDRADALKVLTRINEMDRVMGLV